MAFLRSFRNWRAYRRLPRAWRDIVFYAESGQDWHHLEPLVQELIGALDRKVTYVTSDPGDPALALEHANFTSLCIREGWFLTMHFQFQQAGVVVLTMMDLDHLQLKRSINPVHYVYVFHAMGSTHMVDLANSYDAYDSLLCVGPHHVLELRGREAQAGLPQRNLFAYGYPRLERLMRQGADHARPQGEDARVILLAPTWGDDSILNRCGKELIAVLLEAGYRVIMRPHYQTRRLSPAVVKHLVAAFGDHERFELIEQMGETGSLFRSDLLICDWSSMSIEYALGLEKPVLFVDLPMRVRNPDWQALGIEPFEISIRRQVGEVIAPEAIADAPAAIERLLAEPGEFTRRVRDLRDQAVFNLGHCVPQGAREIARLADQARDSGAGA